MTGESVSRCGAVKRLGKGRDSRTSGSTSLMSGQNSEKS